MAERAAGDRMLARRIKWVETTLQNEGGLLPKSVSAPFGVAAFL